MKRTTRFVFALSFGVVCLASGEPAHFITVDERGCPIAGVQTRFCCTIQTEKGGGFKRFIFVSDSKGCFSTNKDFARLGDEFEWIRKDGYVVEPCLNLHLNGPYFPATREQPFRFVLRKVNAEKALLVCNSGYRYGRRVVARGEKGTPLPLWVVGHADGVGHAEAECFALPSFDEAAKEWRCAFWTTNVHAGVIATTNRVFIAPEDGYQQRIEVPLKMCFSPSFTLYVRSYDPQVYAMFRIYGCTTDQMPDDSRKFKHSEDRYAAKLCPDARRRYGVLEVMNSSFNPFGERILEFDHDLCLAIGPTKYAKDLLPHLVQHRYPPRYDRPARIANAARRKQIADEIHELEDVLWRKRQQLEKETGRKMGWVPDEIAGQDANLIQVNRKIDALYRELSRLEKEAPTLNLPQGEAKRETDTK